MRIYMGQHIHPASSNGSGVRWRALVKGRRLRADTLAGMRELIRDTLADKRG